MTETDVSGLSNGAIWLGSSVNNILSWIQNKIGSIWEWFKLLPLWDKIVLLLGIAGIIFIIWGMINADKFRYIKEKEKEVF